MLRRYLLIAAGCLMAIPSVAMADLADPGIGFQGGDPPCDFSINVTDINPTIQPQNTAGTTNYCVTNNAGAIITSLDFDMTIATGLSKSFVDSIFSISQISGKADFLHDTLTYTSSTGDLNFDFFGVKKPDGDEGCPGKSADIGEREGIPAGCVFTIELSGWVDNLDNGRIYGSGLPDFKSSFTTAPEPSTLLLQGIGLLLLAAVVEFRRRSSASSHS
jgi:hypothetical protein